MSETVEDVVASYPKTVTACHAEISRLFDMLNNNTLQNALEEVASLENERDELKDELEDAAKDQQELEERIEQLEVNPNAAHAINVFLDECERVAPLRYDVPQSDRAMRAIVGLHDAVGRNP